MEIPTPDQDLSEPKTLKITLPARLHLRLHSVKILTGTTISDTVEQALAEFFEEPVEGEGSSRVEPAE